MESFSSILTLALRGQSSTRQAGRDSRSVIRYGNRSSYSQPGPSLQHEMSRVDAASGSPPTGTGIWVAAPKAERVWLATAAGPATRHRSLLPKGTR
jgi:hypothetical protein